MRQTHPFGSIALHAATMLVVLAGPWQRSALADCADRIINCDFGAKGTQGQCGPLGICRDCGPAHCPATPAYSFREVPNKVDENACPEATRQMDGCSNPGLSAISNKLPDPGTAQYNGLFKPACEQHDFCYSSKDPPKSTCDTNFRDNMQWICDRYFTGPNNVVQLGACKSAAGIYYTAVSVKNGPGDGAFTNGHKWGNEHCGKDTTILRTHDDLVGADTLAIYNPAQHRYLRFQPESACKIVDSATGTATLGAIPNNWRAERFKAFDGGNGMVAFYNPYRSCFLRVTSDGGVDAGGAHEPNLPPDWQWERFQVKPQSDGTIALYNPANHRFLRMRPDGVVDAPGKVDDGKLPPDWKWERFQVILVKPYSAY